jgi:hypothetical protein
MGPDHKMNAPDVSLDTEACWKLLERVAASSHLNRAPRLREFLFYVGNQSLKEGISRVHEQEIGSIVFGREPHYDTSQDNIVRVNATELRKRIDAYFVSDGVNEPLSFQIPRGGYKPVFRRRPPALPTPQEEETLAAMVAAKASGPVAAASPGPIHRQLPFMLAVAAATLMVVVSFFLWRQNQSMRTALHPWQSHPALSAFWSGFLNSHQDTDIILADTSFALVEDITGRSYPLGDYLNHSYLDQIQSANISADRRADLNLIALRMNGSMGDFGVVQRIKALDPSSPKLFVLFARDYTSDLIKRNNTILIGSRRSNPWVDLFSDQLNFSVEFDAALDQSLVKNLKPRPGEQAEYVVPIDPYASVGYSVIAYLPNPSHTSNTLIIEGTNSQATDAAGEFVTSEESMESFRNRIATRRFTYFEILLKTTRLNNTPFKAEIITYRVY